MSNVCRLKKKMHSEDSIKSSKSNTKGGEKENSTQSFNKTHEVKSDAIEAIPLQVKVYDNFDRAFKAFRALVQKERILSTYKEKQSYEKPSEKKRRKRNDTRKRIAELESKQQKMLNGDYEKDKLKREKLKKERMEKRSQAQKPKDDSELI
jgi:small subunit ribosomal protein S21